MNRTRSLFFFLMCLLFAGAYGVTRIQSDRQHWPYNVLQDYHCDILPGDHQVHDLRLIDETLDISSLDLVGFSAIVKVEVEATKIVGSIFTPTITLVADGMKSRTTLERGCAGTRYLNISAFCLKKHNTIQLDLRCVKLRSPQVQLLTFKNKDLADAKVMVIAPHPDDAEIAAYGLYSSCKEPVIVTVTAGEKDEAAGISRYLDSRGGSSKLGTLRTWNSLSVPLLAGVSSDNLINLGYCDLTLGDMYRARGRTILKRDNQEGLTEVFRKQNTSHRLPLQKSSGDWQGLIDDFVMVLEKVQPNIIVTPYPLIDGHPDHKYSTIAVIEALKKTGRHGGDLLLYTNHHSLSNYYPFGETGEAVTLPPYFDNRLFCAGLLSLQLSKEMQEKKRIALDAQAALRPGAAWWSWRDNIQLAWDQLLSDFRDLDKSYFRRAIRENELFFIVPVRMLYDENLLTRMVGELQ